MMDRVRWVRGRGDPVTVRRQLDLPADATYLPATGEIRIVVARDADGPVEETTEPMGVWARQECTRVAAGAVPPAVEERTPTAGSVSAVVRRGDGLPASRVVVVSHSPESTGDETNGDDSLSDFKRMVRAAPQNSRATVEFRGEQFTCDLPVYVERVARRERLRQDSEG